MTTHTVRLTMLLAAAILIIMSQGWRIEMGSCNNVNETQDLWKHILERNPDAWIWGGDNVYGDWRAQTLEDWKSIVQNEPERLNNLKTGMWYPATKEKLKHLYDKVKAIPEYQSLVEMVGRENLIGIWDDHDFGLNDFGKNFPAKDASKEAFLEFFDAPEDDPRREHDGIYSVKDFEGGKIRVILLDNRYFRDDYGNETGDMLGEEQWKWFEYQLESSSADFNVIVSGVQVLPDHRFRSRMECWNSLPTARTRLFNLIANSQASGIFFLSGDVHYAEFQLANVSCVDKQFLLPEITVSGMTHSWNTYYAPASYAMDVAQRVLTFQYSFKEKWFLGRNFGEMEFEDIGKPSARVTWRVFDEKGETRLEQSWLKSELKPMGSLRSCEFFPNLGFVSERYAQAQIYLWYFLVLLPFISLFSLAVMICRFACCSSRSSKRKTD